MTAWSVFAHKGRCSHLNAAKASDHGAEFTSKALEAWAWERGVKLDFIHPGKPTESGYTENFNGRLCELTGLQKGAAPHRRTV